jgi:hypothetical protein
MFNDIAQMLHETSNPVDFSVEPEAETWVRPPKNGERLEGLARSVVYQLIEDPSNGIFSISVRRPGTRRGCRLIGQKSLRAFLSRLATEQNARCHERKEVAQ